jgi:hypothetical protein
MRRTLIAVGVAILASLMWIPTYDTGFYGTYRHRESIFSIHHQINMSQMILQTVFIAVAAAVIVNLFRREPKQ